MLDLRTNSSEPNRTGSGSQDLPDVFLFNPFAEAYIAQGSAFTPVKRQSALAEDLANLPQFLGRAGDIVLLRNRPSGAFLDELAAAGFSPSEFVELANSRIDPTARLENRTFRALRPWAWAPDSLAVFEPILTRTAGTTRTADQYFNPQIAQLYSKAWSAAFLRKVLHQCHAECLCSELEAGTPVTTYEAALQAVAAIRSRGAHRLVVKQALGLAGGNAIRLWEPDILPEQKQWLASALENGHELVVEPWLEREADFSMQFEMEPGGLKLCGYTGLINDHRGQFQGNWAEMNYREWLPAKAADRLGEEAQPTGKLRDVYNEVLVILEKALRQAAYLGPISIDAFVYRTPEGRCRLKPVVEINPRYTMGRLTLELMKHASYPGVFRLHSRRQTGAQGFKTLAAYASMLRKRLPLLLEPGASIIAQGTVCLNDPERAQEYLATFQVDPDLERSGLLN